MFETRFKNTARKLPLPFYQYTKFHLIPNNFFSFKGKTVSRRKIRLGEEREGLICGISPVRNPLFPSEDT
jgi:hypothetical protein